MIPVLETRLIARSEAANANREAMLQKLGEVRALEEKVRQNSGKVREKFEKRGQLLPRERVERLLDKGSPFLELSTLAGYKMHDDDGGRNIMGGGLVTGVGMVAGKACVISASDSAIKGGTISPMGVKKGLRVHEIAFENRLPVIYLVESGGANLLYQAEMFVEGGRSFANQARLSAAGIPQIAVVHGSSTAGGAYLPGLSDYVVLVRERSKIFLAGPPLVKAAIGEDTTDEELGGAQLHGTVTGLGEHVADNDGEAILYARAIMEMLEWQRFDGNVEGEAPLHDIEDLLAVVSADDRTPYDIREVIARITDGSRFLEFKSGYSPETVCGHAMIGGMRVGVLGNNGAIMPTGSVKAAQFIQLCDQAGTPLVFLQNTTGYMVGSQAERDGAIKHGSKMIQAVANARVPKFTIIVGGSYGAGNYGMCGRGFSPRFIFAWPSARTAVMGGEQAARVMETITRAKYARMGQTLDEDALKQMSGSIRARMDIESTALYGTARLWDDGIIDPRDTRRILTLCLQLASQADRQALRPNAFGIARM